MAIASHESVEALLDAVLDVSVPLHGAITAFDEAGASYELVGPPGMALFVRDSAEAIRHVSGSPSPTVMPALDDLRRRHLARAGVPAGTDNSHLPALLLICTYLVDADTVARLGLTQLLRRPAEVEALDEEAGRHDPHIEVGDAALRAWTPLTAAHVPGSGEHPAILEIRFRAERYERYAPW
jgi:hypothetical protein